MSIKTLYILVLGQHARILDDEIDLSDTFSKVFRQLKPRHTFLQNVYVDQVTFAVYDTPITLPEDRSSENLFKTVDGKASKPVDVYALLNEELPVDAEDRVISIAMTIPKFGDIEATSTAALERIGKRIDPSCITVKLQSPDKFQESDVRLNDINIVAEIDDQEHFISKLRSELRKARHVHSDRARPYFLSVMRDYFKDHNLFRNTFKETKVASTTNSTKTELNAFVALCSLMDCIDGIIKKSLAMKDSVFSRLIMPALFEMEMNTKPTKFDKTVRWSCPLLVEIQGERFRRRYKPNNNFSLAHPNFSPYIIGEVATDESESNRYRMLIQGAAAVRLGNAMRASKSEEQPFILQAIYLTKDFVAERYLMYQDDVKSPGVRALRDVFDIKCLKDAVGILKELYNYAEVVKKENGNWDMSQKSLMAYLQESVKDLVSLSYVQPARRCRPSFEYTGDDDNSSDEYGIHGVFEHKELRSVVDSAGFEILIVSDSRPHVAAVTRSGRGDAKFILKYIKADDISEVNILRYLAELKSDQNHAIPLLEEFKVSGGIIVVFPCYPLMLSDLFDLEVDLRLSLARQFIDGVTFMHEHGVAHLDLNPSNVVVDLKTQLLRIIDFSLSIRVYGGEDADMIGYFVGTLGWTAPEVGKPDRQPRRFSATRADVWACGKVVKDLWGRGMPSPLLNPLHDVAQMLLAEDPRSRPRMKDVCLSASNLTLVLALRHSHPLQTSLYEQRQVEIHEVIQWVRERNRCNAGQPDTNDVSWNLHPYCINLKDLQGWNLKVSIK